MKFIVLATDLCACPTDCIGMCCACGVSQTGITSAVKTEQARGIGLDTWGVDFTRKRKNNTLLSNPFHYRDARTDGMLNEAFKRMPRAKIFSNTGIQFMQINTYQLLAMSMNLLCLILQKLTSPFPIFSIIG
jgi:sugar (pentulose or hexulose) kinase